MTLEQLKEMCAQATARPWKLPDGWSSWISNHEHGVANANTRETARAIVAAMNAIDALIAVVEATRNAVHLDDEASLAHTYAERAYLRTAHPDDTIMEAPCATCAALTALDAKLKEAPDGK